MTKIANFSIVDVMDMETVKSNITFELSNILQPYTSEGNEADSELVKKVHAEVRQCFDSYEQQGEIHDYNITVTVIDLYHFVVDAWFDRSHIGQRVDYALDVEITPPKTPKYDPTAFDRAMKGV